MTAYRDDLEAAQLRADDLEREVAALRERNQKLAAELAGGDTSEATMNARRLAAAIVREHEEQRMRDQADLDERAARERALADRRWRYNASPGDPEIAQAVFGFFGFMIVLVAFANLSVGLVALIFAGGILGFLNRAGRGAPGGDQQ